MDNLALYSIDFFSFFTDDGILHILQAAILADYYDEIRNQMVDAVGETKVHEVETNFACALETVKLYM